MKKTLWLACLVGILLMPGMLISKSIPQDMGPAGTKIWVSKSLYFVWQFDKKPVMGTLILKVKVFDKDGNQKTDLVLSGTSGMPAMGSAHDSGKVKFKKNKKGDYLLPINVVMPGEWVVDVLVQKGKLVLMNGRIRFNV